MSESVKSETPLVETIAELDALYARATPGEWFWLKHECADEPAAAKLLATIVGLTETGDNYDLHGLGAVVEDANVGHKTTAITGCGHDSPHNARLLAALVNAWPQIRSALSQSEGRPKGDEAGVSTVARSPDEPVAAAADADITHVICFHGEGAEVILCCGWPDVRTKFFDGVFGTRADWDDEQVQAWDATFADDDYWMMNEDHELYCFRADVSEITAVKIYVVSRQDKSSSPPLPANQQNAVAAQSEGWVSDARRYRAWRDGEVVVRKAWDGDGWEARNAVDPHWDVGSWFWRQSLDDAIDAAMLSAAPTVNEAPKQGAI